MKIHTHTILLYILHSYGTADERMNIIMCAIYFNNGHNLLLFSIFRRRIYDMYTRIYMYQLLHVIIVIYVVSLQWPSAAFVLRSLCTRPALALRSCCACTALVLRLHCARAAHVLR